MGNIVMKQRRRTCRLLREVWFFFFFFFLKNIQLFCLEQKFIFIHQNCLSGSLIDMFCICTPLSASFSASSIRIVPSHLQTVTADSFSRGRRRVSTAFLVFSRTSPMTTKSNSRPWINSYQCLSQRIFMIKDDFSKPKERAKERV